MPRSSEILVMESQLKKNKTAFSNSFKKEHIHTINQKCYAAFSLNSSNYITCLHFLFIYFFVLIFSIIYLKKINLKGRSTKASQYFWKDSPGGPTLSEQWPQSQLSVHTEYVTT